MFFTLNRTWWVNLNYFKTTKISLFLQILLKIAFNLIWAVYTNFGIIQEIITYKKSMANSYLPISQDINFNLVSGIQLWIDIWYRLNSYMSRSQQRINLTLFKMKLHPMVLLRLSDLVDITEIKYAFGLIVMVRLDNINTISVSFLNRHLEEFACK